MTKCINVYISRGGKNKNLSAQRSNSNTVWFNIADVAEWFRALDIMLSDWCCST